MSRNPKKSKFGKVRRFSYMYDSPRSTSSIVLRTLLSITMVFVLAFIGWNAYVPYGIIFPEHWRLFPI